MSIRYWYYVINGKWIMFCFRVKSFPTVARFRFKQWAFKWVIDEEGDIGLQVFGYLTMLKYKQATIFLWNKKYPEAPKRLHLKENGVA